MGNFHLSGSALKIQIYTPAALLWRRIPTCSAARPARAPLQLPRPIQVDPVSFTRCNSPGPLSKQSWIAWSLGDVPLYMAFSLTTLAP